ncbi:MAG: hypothetical protein R3B13_08505 [Polyangiaceae bacterium]
MLLRAWVGYVGALVMFAAVGCGGGDSSGSPSASGGASGGDASVDGSGAVAGSGAAAGSGGGTGAGAGAGGVDAGDAGPDSGVDCSKYVGVTLDAACAQMATAMCGVYQCIPSTSPFASDSVCLERMKLTCATSVSLPGSGLVAADMAWMAASLEALSCVDVYTQPSLLTKIGMRLPVCGSAGTLANGQGCHGSQQCTSGYCTSAYNSCGVCTAKLVAGESCSQDAQCLSGACRHSKCVTLQPLGGPCTTYLDCAEDMYCEVPGKCAAKLPAGGACGGDDAACASGLVCGATDTCEAPTLGQVGASCSVLVKLSCDVFHDVDCDLATQKCVAAPPALPGEACGGSSGKHCGPGVSCVAATCVTDAQDSAACDDTKGPRCVPPASCQNGTCSAVPSNCKSN